jgi:exodeoxyribonuclease VII small subunit
MSKKKNEFSFDEAFAELQQINVELESGNISIDALTQKTKHAMNLIAQCKEKLYAVEIEINKITEEDTE